MAEKQCPDCKMTIDKDAKVCPYCRKKFSSSSVGCILIIIIVLILLGVIGMMSGGSPKQPSTTPSTVSVGQEGRLQASPGGDLVPVSVSSAALEQWTKARVAKDQQGMVNLIASGNVLSVDTGTKVLVIDQEMYIRKIRILEGKFTGRSGWVAYERIHPL